MFYRNVYPVSPESYEQIVEVTVGNDAVTQQLSKFYAPHQNWNVYEQNVEGPKNSNGPGSLQIVRIIKVQESGGSSQDEPERVQDVLMPEVRELETGSVEKIIAAARICGLACSVGTAQGY